MWVEMLWFRGLQPTVLQFLKVSQYSVVVRPHEEEGLWCGIQSAEQ